MSTGAIEALSRDVCSLLEVDTKKRNTASKLLASQPARSRTKIPFDRKKKPHSPAIPGSLTEGSSKIPRSSSKRSSPVPPRLPPPPLPDRYRPRGRSTISPPDETRGGSRKSYLHHDKHGRSERRPRSRSRSRSRDSNRILSQKSDASLEGANRGQLKGPPRN